MPLQFYEKIALKEIHVILHRHPAMRLDGAVEPDWGVSDASGGVHWEPRG